MKRVRIIIKGIVQGVGFRPFVYRLASELDLKGWVNNTGSEVIIEAEGEANALEKFESRLGIEAPALSAIRSLNIQELEPADFHSFDILESSIAGQGKQQGVFVSPDISICNKCTQELFDEKDRRYLYPFINCTDCGPRFTIVKDVPYDRDRTTMSVFAMCEECAGEYSEPSNRRYHAQPVSCYHCGPAVWLMDRNGSELQVQNPISKAISLLSEGRILAVKGIGGYHLVCDASNPAAVAELRRRKIRDDKPFAIMARNMQVVERFCHISPEEKHLLENEKRPIVLFRKSEGIRLPEEIAPRNSFLGIMLPYTPIHLLLFKGTVLFDTLVMTSGNRSSEPICYKEEEAVQTLGTIADYFLANNREIHTRVDDSVIRSFRGREYPIRRSRGYVPAPVRCDIFDEEHAAGKTIEAVALPDSAAPVIAKDNESAFSIPTVLATGGELKSTFCMNKGTEFYISQHIEDLENYETLRSFEEGIDHFKKLFGLRPEIIAYDLHPGYLSTKYALTTATGKRVGIQHHHAHIAACMADNELKGEVIGVAFDGAGYGEDGNLWGGEFFSGGLDGFIRQGHLEYVKMPGGEAAIREPWRMAAAYLYHTFGGDEDICNMKVLQGIGEIKREAVFQMLEKSVNCPMTSSMGRLFDAVSALLNIRQEIRYEGQAAIELEFASYGADGSSLRESCGSRPQESYGSRPQESCGSRPQESSESQPQVSFQNRAQQFYDFELRQEAGLFVVDVGNTIKEILRDLESGEPVSIISLRFHKTAAQIVLAGCEAIRKRTGLDRVALSGGVFQNMTLLEQSVSLLEKSGFEVFIHHRVPANDGGISLGQAAMVLALALQQKQNKTN